MPQEGLGLCALALLRLHPCADVRLALTLTLTLVPIPCTISLSEKLVFWGSQLLPARVAHSPPGASRLLCIGMFVPGVSRCLEDVGPS